MMQAQIIMAVWLAPSLILAAPASRFVKSGAHKVHYLSVGKGSEAAVFIHGWTCDATFWKAQAPVYEKRRSLIIDLPGHGESDKPEIAYSMELFAQAVNSMLVKEKVTKATLIGHSMGVPVALQVLRMQPQKVAGIVIVDGFIPSGPAPKEQVTAMTKMYRAADYQESAKKMLASMFTPKTDAALRAEIEKRMLGAPQHVMAGAMEGMMAMQPLMESYPKVPVTAVMVKRAARSQYPDFLKQHFRLEAFEEFEGAGHFLMMEEPVRFNAILEKALSGR